MIDNVRMLALVNTQGTATHETALCSLHKHRAGQLGEPDDWDGKPAQDCTGNEYLQCVICGANTVEKDGKGVRLWIDNELPAVPGDSFEALRGGTIQDVEMGLVYESHGTAPVLILHFGDGFAHGIVLPIVED